MPIRDIKLTVGNEIKGYGVLKSYPFPTPDDVAAGEPRIKYKMPLYTLTVEGTDGAGNSKTKDFNIFRFGIYRENKRAAARVVGLANKQTHIIKKYKHDYELHSAGDASNGAWVVWKTFYIHDGADDPQNQAYGTIGCVEVCDPDGFIKLNDFIIELGGSTKPERDEKLIEIGASGKMVITYLKAPKPPLVVAP